MFEKFLRGVLFGCCVLVCSRGWGSVDITLRLNIVETSSGRGTFELFALGNADLSAGLASYHIPLAGGIESLTHSSPWGMSSGNSMVGFGGFGRSQDGNGLLTASQDTINASGMIVYDMGMRGGDLNAFFSDPNSLLISVQPIYSAALQIAHGEWANDLPQFMAGGTIAGNVFLDSRNGGTREGVFQTEVRNSAIPEPTAAIYWLGGLIVFATGKSAGWLFRRLSGKLRVRIGMERE